MAKRRKKKSASKITVKIDAIEKNKMALSWSMPGLSMWITSIPKVSKANMKMFNAGYFDEWTFVVKWTGTMKMSGAIKNYMKAGHSIIPQLFKITDVDDKMATFTSKWGIADPLVYDLFVSEIERMGAHGGSFIIVDSWSD